MIMLDSIVSSLISFYGVLAQLDPTYQYIAPPSPSLGKTKYVWAIESKSVPP